MQLRQGNIKSTAYYPAKKPFYLTIDLKPSAFLIGGR